ncbi:MAG: M1 family aminopeptidase, partial [Nannocystaceae bacterium]
GPAALLGFAEQFSGRFTTVHEFGHQYFQGLLASNEFNQPWLDEGINTTSNMLVMYDWHPEDPWVAKIGNQKLTIDDSVRMALLGAITLDAVDRQVDTYRAFNPNYGVTVYRKTAALMLTLRNLVGHKVFDKALRAYADSFRFRHPTGKDLTDKLVATIGQRVTLAKAKLHDDDPEHPESQPEVVLDVQAYLDQALQTVDVVDYKLRTLKIRRIAGNHGWHRDDADALVGGEAPEDLGLRVAQLDDDVIETLVVVDRKGGFPVPVELEVEFEDGSTERRTWDGKAEYRAFLFPGKRAVRATLDPDKKLLLEAHTLDNTRTRKRTDDGLSAAVRDTTELAQLLVIGGMGL